MLQTIKENFLSKNLLNIKLSFIFITVTILLNSICYSIEDTENEKFANTKMSNNMVQPLPESKPYASLLFDSGISFILYDLSMNEGVITQINNRPFLLIGSLLSISGITIGLTSEQKQHNTKDKKENVLNGNFKNKIVIKALTYDVPFF